MHGIALGLPGDLQILGLRSYQVAAF